MELKPNGDIRSEPVKCKKRRKYFKYLRRFYFAGFLRDSVQVR